MNNYLYIDHSNVYMTAPWHVSTESDKWMVSRSSVEVGDVEEYIRKQLEAKVPFYVELHPIIVEARQHGIKLLLVSGGFTFFTDRLKPRLGFDYAFSNTLEIDNGKLTGRVSGPLLDANAKAHHVARLRDGLNLTRDQVIVIGDGANDLNMMAETNCSVAYRAKPIVRQHASYALNYVGLDGLLNVFPA